MARQRQGSEGMERPHEQRTQAVVGAWKASGQSASAFAPRHGIAATTLFGWQCSLRRRERARSAEPAAGFVGVKLVDGLAARPPAFEVVLRGRRVVRVRPGFDERELSRLLLALERPTC